MVRIFFILFSLLLSQLSFAENNLQLRVDKNEVELGKPVQVSIISQGIKKDLTAISFDELKKNFGIIVLESASKLNESNNKVQELRIELYPNQTGQLEIPTIHFEGYKTSPLAIRVLTAKEIGKTISFIHEISTSSLWQRQQTIITATVVTHSKFAILETDEYIQNGIESYKLDLSRKDLGNGRFQLTAGWVLYPLISGENSISLPAIKYKLKGKIQRRFIVPKIKFQVKKLPFYIPPLMPVGKINIKQKMSATTPKMLTIEISSDSVLPSTLPNLPQEHINDENIIIDQNSSESAVDINNGKFHSKIYHRSLMSFSRSGIYNFPEVEMKYFDPQTGKIVSTQSQPVSILIIAPWLRNALILILIVIFLKLGVKTFVYLQRYLDIRSQRKSIINSILSATSPHELHTLLNAYAKTFNWGSNMTLKNWELAWRENKEQSALSAIKKLSYACYSGRWSFQKQSSLNIEIHSLLTI